ncbi:MAG: fumarate hydratase C-terminal domain-containing protein [Kiritimatiellia bacterium]
MKNLDYPFTLEQISKLKIGDMVCVSGRVFTGRDRLHRYLAEGGECPVDMTNGALFHCGPLAMQCNGTWRVIAAGPTTSMRHERYMPAVATRHGIRVIIGKGGMGEATRKLCADRGCVYLQTVGGSGSLIASRVAEVRAVYFLEKFGPTESLWDLVFTNLEAVVTIDAQGRSLHDRICQASRRVLRGLLSRTEQYV